MEIYITISKHAKERFFERKDQEEIVRHFAYKAFHGGKSLSEAEFQKKFDIGIKYENGKYWTRLYKKQGDLLYVFGGKTERPNQQTWKLITVLPIL